MLHLQVIEFYLCPLVTIHKQQKTAGLNTVSCSKMAHNIKPRLFIEANIDLPHLRRVLLIQNILASLPAGMPSQTPDDMHKIYIITYHPYSVADYSFVHVTVEVAATDLHRIPL